MAKNEDGEFELILGNRQLLSVFFIVVVLLGVFFAMGYILGHNSGPIASEASTKKADKPLVVESPSKDQSTPQPAAAAPAPQPPAPEKSASAPPPEKAEKAAPAPEKKAPEKPQPPKQVAKAEPPAKELPKYKPLTQPPPSSSQPVNGAMYLQLAATTKADADVMVDVLRSKGFKALAAQIPEKKEMYRVLVGPIAENAANKTKADLQNSGFPGDKAIKRTF